MGALLNLRKTSYKPINSNGLKHQTQALMGATRLASGFKAKTHRRVIGAVCEPLLNV